MRFVAGMARWRVVILQPAKSLDSSGAPITTYTAAGNRWARRLNFRPVEIEREAQRQAVAGVQLLLRLDSLTRTMTTEWRVRLDGADLLIAGIEPNLEHGTVIITGEAAQE